MTEHRPYRDPLPSDEAVAGIARNAGAQFDPEGVRVFLETARNGGPEDGTHAG